MDGKRAPIGADTRHDREGELTQLGPAKTAAPGTSWSLAASTAAT